MNKHLKITQDQFGGQGMGKAMFSFLFPLLPPSAPNAHKLLLADSWARLASCKAVITWN